MQLIGLKFTFFAILRITRLPFFSPDYNVTQLRHQKRRPFTGLSLKAIRLFQISPAELKKIREIEKWLDPNVIEPKHKQWLFAALMIVAIVCKEVILLSDFAIYPNSGNVPPNSFTSRRDYLVGKAIVNKYH